VARSETPNPGPLVITASRRAGLAIIASVRTATARAMTRCTGGRVTIRSHAEPGSRAVEPGEPARRGAGPGDRRLGRLAQAAQRVPRDGHRQVRPDPGMLTLLAAVEGTVRHGHQRGGEPLGERAGVAGRPGPEERLEH